MPLKQAKPTARKAPARTRRVSESPPVSRSRREPVLERASPAISPNEKRQLILAHAEMRRTRDPVQLASLWMGVFATFAVVVGCWAWAFTPSMLKAVKAPMPEIHAVSETITATKQSVEQVLKDRAVKDQAAKAVKQLETLKEEAAVRQQTLDQMAELLSATSTASDASTSTRSQLFHAPPAAVSTSSSTTSTH